MKGKSRGTGTEREYSDTDIQKKLTQWYSEKKPIRLAPFCYVVYDKGMYYLMKQTIPEIFFTDDATPLKGVNCIEVKEKEIIIKGIKENNAKVMIECHLTCAVEELLHWAN